jgi:hypothetical protein
VADGSTARIRVNGSEDVICTFTNTPAPATNALEDVSYTIADVGDAVGGAVGGVAAQMPAPIRGPIGLGLMGVAALAGLGAALLSYASLRRRRRVGPGRADT